MQDLIDNLSKAALATVIHEKLLITVYSQQRINDEVLHAAFNRNTVDSKIKEIFNYNFCFQMNNIGGISEDGMFQVFFLIIFHIILLKHSVRSNFRRISEVRLLILQKLYLYKTKPPFLMHSDTSRSEPHTL